MRLWLEFIFQSTRYRNYGPGEDTPGDKNKIEFGEAMHFFFDRFGRRER